MMQSADIATLAADLRVTFRLLRRRFRKRATRQAWLAGRIERLSAEAQAHLVAAAIPHRISEH